MRWTGRFLPGAWRAGLLVLAALICVPAWGVIKQLYPLADIIADADTIFVAKVASRDAKAHRVLLQPAVTLKGPVKKVRMTVALAGGDERTQLAVLEKRLPRGRTVVLFGKNKRFALGYTNGTWFRLAEPTDAGGLWQFVHLEPYLTRTYRGSTESLRRTISRVLSGTGKAPEPDPAARPGYGPA